MCFFYFKNLVQVIVEKYQVRSVAYKSNAIHVVDIPSVLIVVEHNIFFTSLARTLGFG